MNDTLRADDWEKLILEGRFVSWMQVVPTFLAVFKDMRTLERELAAANEKREALYRAIIEAGCEFRLDDKMNLIALTNARAERTESALAAANTKAGEFIDAFEHESGMTMSQVDWDVAALTILRAIKQQAESALSPAGLPEDEKISARCVDFPYAPCVMERCGYAGPIGPCKRPDGPIRYRFPEDKNEMLGARHKGFVSEESYDTLLALCVAQQRELAEAEAALLDCMERTTMWYPPEHAAPIDRARGRKHG